VNYAVPIQVLASFVDKAMKGQYKPIARKEPLTGQAGFHGIVLVPNVVERTPPFVEEVLPNSPAARAGLRPDDLIVYIDGEQISSVKAFNDLIDRTPPGTTLRFEVRRFEKEFGTSVERLITMELKLDPPRQRGPGKKR
jgi:serine protease Do